MVIKFEPKADEIYMVENHAMFHILEGQGAIQVDFRNYYDWENKIIFLEKGQYIRFLNSGFVVRKLEFQEEERFRNEDLRVLFKHLVSIGYINFHECSECQQYLEKNIFSDPLEIVDISSRQWYWQNPFRAEKDEYHVIFDVKDIIDDQFKNRLTNRDLSNLLKGYNLNPFSLYTDKVGITIKSLLERKRLLESKREVAFTDKSIKEIAYEHGYNDPAYFNRAFKLNTGKSPGAFRESIEIDREDRFSEDLFSLLHDFHKEHRKADFYADQLNMSVKTLSKKVKEKLQVSLGQLIRHHVLQSAKELLKEHEIREVSFQLGFEEPNHFSAFFKHYTGETPTDYLLRNKYKS